MAVYNEINVGRFNRGLQKFLALKGGPPSPQLQADISPNFNLESGTAMENRYLYAVDTFSFGTSVAAVAAQVASIRLRNSLTSNAIAVIEKIVVANQGAAADNNIVLRHGVTSNDLSSIATPGLGGTLDARTQRQTALRISSQTTAAAPAIGGADASIEIASLAPNAMTDLIFYDNQEIPLLPGDAVQLNTSVVNQSVLVLYRWRERFLEESERT